MISTFQDIEPFIVAGTVKKFDENEDIELYSYISCDEKSDDRLKQIRGMIFAKEDHTLIANTFPFTDTLVAGKDNNVIKTNILPTSKIFVMREGSVIRVFFRKNRWYISTQRKLDATKSHWSSEITFGDLFKLGISKIISTKNGTQNAIEDDVHTFLGMLNPAFTYFFTLQNTEENRIVCAGTKSTNPVIYFSGVQKHCQSNFEFDLSEQFCEWGFKTFVELELAKIDSVEPTPMSELMGTDFAQLATHNPKVLEQIRGWTSSDIIKYVRFYFNIMRSPGLIIFNKNKTPVRIVSEQYFERFNIRGNQPNISYRYLQIRHEPEQIELLLKTYPKFEPMIGKIEYTLRVIAQFILSCYKQRHIYHNFVFINKEEHNIVEKCHNLYQRERKPITYDCVWKIMEQQEPGYLHNMLNARKCYE